MAALICRRVRGQVEARQDHAEEEPAAMLPADEIGVLALPTDARRLCERLLTLWLRAYAKLPYKIPGAAKDYFDDTYEQFAMKGLDPRAFGDSHAP